MLQKLFQTPSQEGRKLTFSGKAGWAKGGFNGSEGFNGLGGAQLSTAFGLFRSEFIITFAKSVCGLEASGLLLDSDPVLVCSSLPFSIPEPSDSFLSESSSSS